MTVRESLKSVNLRKGDILSCIIEYPFGSISFDVSIIDGNMCIFSPCMSEKWCDMILGEEALSCDYNIERAVIKIAPVLERKLFPVKV